MTNEAATSGRDAKPTSAPAAHSASAARSVPAASAAHSAPAAPAVFRAYSAEFRGAEGMAALSTHGSTFQAKDPSIFRAKVDVIPLAATRLVSMRATPHRSSWGDAQIAEFDSETVLFHFLLAGSNVGHMAGRTFAHHPGSVQVFHRSAPFHAVTDSPVHVVSFWLPTSLLRGEAVEALRGIVGVDFENDPLAAGATAMIHSLLVAPPEPGSASAVSLETILTGVLEALILGADAERRSGADVRDLYGRVRALLGEELERSPRETAEIAARLRVDPSAITRALLAHGTTLPVLLRELRLDELARLLREDRSGASLAELADLSGFRGFSQAARAFKGRFVMTMGEYRTLSGL